MGERVRRGRAAELSLRADRWVPPALDAAAQAALKAAVQQPPTDAGLALANGNGKVVRAFSEQRFERALCRSSCLNYLHRLGFVVGRPKKRRTKADAAKRAEFVRLYAVLRPEAARTGVKIFFVDDAHFRADADLRGLWVLQGEPALVDSTSPSLKEKVVYYSAVCLETGEVEEMAVAGNCTAATSVAFLQQGRAAHSNGLIVIWDNGPAHRGEALRTSLATPDLNLRLVPLPGYSPDYNADEGIWDWIREDVTANTCWGSQAKVREKVGAFLAGLRARADEVKCRCRTALPAQADAWVATTGLSHALQHVDPTLALL